MTFTLALQMPTKSCRYCTRQLERTLRKRSVALFSTRADTSRMDHVQSYRESRNSFLGLIGGLGILAAGGGWYVNQHSSHPDSTLTRSPHSQCEPTGRNQPQNVMIHRMRSIKGRGLTEKYNIDWNTVLGEGAYGSVHPARLAATGEKVRATAMDPEMIRKYNGSLIHIFLLLLLWTGRSQEDQPSLHQFHRIQNRNGCIVTNL